MSKLIVSSQEIACLAMCSQTGFVVPPRDGDAFFIIIVGSYTTSLYHFSKIYSLHTQKLVIDNQNLNQIFRVMAMSCGSLREGRRSLPGYPVRQAIS